jgi:putative ABC transport system substrate-binding protein
MPLIGVLRGGHKESDPLFAPFRELLSELGYEDGRNLRLLYRWAEGHGERLPALAQELVGQGVDLLVTTGTVGTQSAQRATSAIPIVSLSDDLVDAGLVASMARPGGNTTGVSILANDLDAKRLEVLHDYVPQARRIAVLFDPSTLSGARQLDGAARDLGLDLVRFPAREPAEVDRALADIAAAQVGAVNVLASPFLNNERGLIVGRLNDARLPAIYQWPETAIEGGCLAYGPRLASCYRQLASLVVKVLRGGRPADLPIEQPTKFDLLVNLRTAKAIGLHVPATLLLRADEVIE